ncbi:hypothetical protein XaraCFBP7407_08860 [Xanthomonas arboricola pv. arracaciae]|nr:hypothetical protein XaraCFBP7407_08860 [Xanthomonas arboricola pv. arracaciae]
MFKRLLARNDSPTPETTWALIGALEHMSEDRLIVERLPSVLARVGRSRASLYRDIAAGQFPSPVKIGERAIGWDPRVVDNWIAERFATAESRAQ